MKQDIEFITLSFSVELEFEDALQGYFLMNFEPQGFEEQSDGSFLVHLLKEEWNQAASEGLQVFLQSLPPGSLVTIDEIITHKPTDWNALWEAGIEPLPITDELVITPSWKLAEAPKSKYRIVIDPKMSFGTGHHETTRLCLKMIERIDCTNREVLDIGSGTGVLAMYAMLRGAKSSVAIDTDEWAFANAKENCTLNGFTDEQIDLRFGDLSSTIEQDRTFDIIIANIHRNVLLAISTQIASHQKPSGILILSGLLEYDAQEIVESYETAGYKMIERLQENEWVSLRFEYKKK